MQNPEQEVRVGDRLDWLYESALRPVQVVLADPDTHGRVYVRRVYPEGKRPKGTPAGGTYLWVPLSELRRTTPTTATTTLECLGHPASAHGPGGVTEYCDGSCRGSVP